MNLGLRASLLLGALMCVAFACMDQRPAGFPHAVHLASQHCGAPGGPSCLSCASCHKSLPGNEALSLPQASLCVSCHDEGTPRFRQPTRDPGAAFSRTVHFSHPRHLAMPELRGQCTPCHAGVALGSDKQPRFPPMQQCFSCHEHKAQWERAECGPCHERADVQKVLPETFLRHDEGFSRHHAAAATARGEMCATCHTKAQCDDCHDVNQGLQVERRRPEALEANFQHRGDFMTRHAIEAERDSAQCMRCHTARSCDDCHLARGVSANRKDAANPHPPQWVGSFPGDRNFHGRAARRDIAACAACHDQGPATNCIGCHRVGAYGGNPHPNGWTSARSENSTMCRYCHGGAP
jgi:predicted CXXCH cytochrome family protein